MKTQTGIWIDGNKAVVISFNEGKERILKIDSKIEDHSHHVHHEGSDGSILGKRGITNEAKIQERKRFQTHKFLDQVVAEVKDAGEVFIMGPSGMKMRLKTKMKADKEVGQKLKAVLPAGHLTLNQCVAKVREFYKL